MVSKVVLIKGTVVYNHDPQAGKSLLRRHSTSSCLSSSSSNVEGQPETDTQEIDLPASSPCPRASIPTKHFHLC
ncbi:hypothetical protein E2C01_034628 [Portunus trituberculatus]|uniref:Uncharacterized protein n=1 Tax=Portunus trituberculatus TaxID=210409 RepID=A0A5B7F682_PORTR|nr:hypothetical protein [Portunus trituberculatus]